MATKLQGSLKRELVIGRKPYMLTITGDGFKLVPKGRRKGRELAWRDIVSGEAALAVALNASLANPMHPRQSTTRRAADAATARRRSDTSGPRPRGRSK